MTRTQIFCPLMPRERSDLASLGFRAKNSSAAASESMSIEHRPAEGLPSRTPRFPWRMRRFSYSGVPALLTVVRCQFLKTGPFIPL